MEKPPPPESIASMWPVLVSAAEDGLRRAQSTSAEQWRIWRQGERWMKDVFGFFQSYGDESEVGASLDLCFQVLNDVNMGDSEDTDQAPTRAITQSAVNTLCDEGRMYSTIDDQHFKTTG